MPDVLDRLAAVLLDASLAATAIAGLVVLAMIQCRQPARRRDWARAGLISTLALLPLAGLNPVPRIDVRGPLWSLLGVGPEEPSNRPRREPGGGARRAPDPERSARSPEPRPAAWTRQSARALVVLYGLGALGGLGWMALGLMGSTWLVRRAWAASPGSLALYRSLPFRGASRRPELAVSGRAARPVLVGVFRPSILIPPILDDPQAGDRLRLSLLHELAHAENFDHRYAAAATLAQAVWFFVPPVWWIRDQLKLDQEFLADRGAVGHFGTSGRYASSLVELAAPARSAIEPEVRAPGMASEVGTFDGPSPSSSALLQRVLMLVKCPFAIEGRTPLWWRWSTASTLALATLAASCLTFRGLASPAGPPSPPPEAGSRTFRLRELTMTQRDRDDQPFDLRFRLPERFLLSFEVMGEPADLSGVEVLGHRLGAAVGPRPALAGDAPWHSVRIARDGPSEWVEVDGRTLPADEGPARLSPWLTIRPAPGNTARIRDLALDW